MRITSLTIGNFKGIAAKANIPLAPITLLFGANSTGKSTVLHAMLYLYEVVVNRNFDPVYSAVTGEQLWLGGFKNLVHGKRLDSVITLGATLKFDDEEIWDNYLTSAEDWLLEKHLGFWPESTADDMSFELDLAWDSYKNRVYVSRYECQSKGQTYLKFEAQAGRPNATVTHYQPLSHWHVEDEFSIDNIFKSGIFEPFDILSRDALPPLDQRIDLSQVPFSWDDVWEEHPLAARLFAEGSVSQAALAPIKHLARKLDKLFHIGPLRIIPTCESKVVLNIENTDWYSGKTAWDLFSISSERFQQRVNHCFNDASMFNSGYVFEIESQPESIVETKRVILHDTLSNVRLLPSSVGIGVSQVFPFVVGASLDVPTIMSCEQPELHIHPKWQLALADIMLDACKRQPEQMFLVETHSEHMMLRLLKRIANASEECPLVPSDISVINVYKHCGSLCYQKQNITADGDFELDWPQGFFEERYGEL
ncbi:AAA family ATPase [Shewanella algae]|uniref:AAA family ATPase n=1 Tax=Shewanella algae TaxID=38313 RepID=UPI001AAE2ADB|nr:AAA family ATPase [Shewanella algae]MBO2581745.1 AAA family ATPase [Shewanella algae]